MLCASPPKLEVEEKRFVFQPTGRQTDIQADRHTHRQTHIHSRSDGTGPA